MNLLADAWKLLVVLFMFLFSHQSSVVKALSCYQCNSFTDADCKDTGKLDKFKVPCPDKTVGCRRIYYKLDLGHSGKLEDRLVRQCSKTRRALECTSVFGTNGKRYKQYTCECDTDNCNQSTRSKPLSFFTCAIAMVTVFMLV